MSSILLVADCCIIGTVFQLHILSFSIVYVCFEGTGGTLVHRAKRFVLFCLSGIRFVSAQSGGSGSGQRKRRDAGRLGRGAATCSWIALTCNMPSKSCAASWRGRRLTPGRCSRVLGATSRDALGWSGSTIGGRRRASSTSPRTPIGRDVVAPASLRPAARP